MLFKTLGDVIVLNVTVSGYLILHSVCSVWNQISIWDQDCTFYTWQLELVIVFKQNASLLEWHSSTWPRAVVWCKPAASTEGEAGPFLSKLFSDGTALMQHCQHPRHTSDTTLDSTPELPCFHGHSRAGERARLWRDSDVFCISQTSSSGIWALSNVAVSDSHLSYCSLHLQGKMWVQGVTCSGGYV